MLKKIIFITMIFSCLTAAHASKLSSPIGEWITISDKTHDKSGIVEIYDDNGKLYGRIVKVFPSKDRHPNDLCKLCPGNFKNKPIQGLEFLWDFTQKDQTSWTNGQLLDPKNGKIYKGSIKLIDGGKKLELRGYWGIFSRSQTWIRVE
jgi:uncharacterized protein (DUF2147 family)